MLVALVAASATAASPAFAANRADGSGSLSGLQILGVFVGIPVGLFVIIALLVSLPTIVGGPRYRPGVTWWASPVWFGGPEGLDSATPEEIASALPEQAPTSGGGTSARW